MYDMQFMYDMQLVVQQLACIIVRLTTEVFANRVGLAFLLIQ